MTLKAAAIRRPLDVNCTWYICSRNACNLPNLSPICSYASILDPVSAMLQEHQMMDQKLHVVMAGWSLQTLSFPFYFGLRHELYIRFEVSPEFCG